MKLIVFDVDGTLVDSQADITASMARAFEGQGMACPDRPTVLSIVGLSLPQAMARLAPEADDACIDALVAGYKEAYIGLRAEKTAAVSSPLYPGIRDMLERLHKRDDLLLGVATGKSRRGLDKVMEAHDLAPFFVTQQVADHHPSKPHPAMLREAMAECAVSPADTVMIGDTSFDMHMAQSAGCAGIGVSWGYHDRAALEPALAVLDDISTLPDILSAHWGISI